MIMPGALRSFTLACSLACILLRVSAQPDAALQAYREGRYSDALAICQADASGNPGTHKLRGDCLQKTGKPSLALEAYQQARQDGYSGDDLFLHRGICLVTLGLPEEARPDLLLYLGRNPSSALAHYWLGTAEYIALDNGASLRWLNEALWLDSTSADAYFLRAANYVEMGKGLLALEDFEMAYRMNPQLHRAKLNMAVILLDMQRYRSAIEVLSELKLESLDITSEVLYYRGEAFFRMHDMEGACADWSEAAALGDADAAENYRRICTDRNGKVRFKRRSYAAF